MVSLNPLSLGSSWLLFGHALQCHQGDYSTWGHQCPLGSESSDSLTGHGAQAAPLWTVPFSLTACLLIFHFSCPAQSNNGGWRQQSLNVKQDINDASLLSCSDPISTSAFLWFSSLTLFYISLNSATVVASSHQIIILDA